MFQFFRGEIEGSIITDNFTCYIMARSALEAENKLIEYYETNLIREYGEMMFINVVSIDASEYYGFKKLNTCCCI